ncbi:hypothetical protein EW026_g7558 [Hermanssonia centrifuga]|uniref:Uncharacterized protein n=1 Tax=Hermanssonia centrifuga TaxID=98765 RepID=A0A4S4K7E7_9APHY|nr:hypothetical protein EW026_g7558 [Hermanssonia centrifuga]
MKSFFVLASLAACALAQRLSILEPTTGNNISSSGSFTVELHQAQSTSDVDQVSVVIALTPCYDVCDDPSQWGLATVLYNGAFNPQYNTSQPQKGLYQDFVLPLSGWPTGGSVLSVAHLLDIGALRIPSFDYSAVQVNVV